MTASEDLCAYPGCVEGEGSLVHWCAYENSHPPYLPCHPFQSARETADREEPSKPVARSTQAGAASNRADILPLWVLPAAGGDP